VPVGLLADKVDRPKLLAVGLGLWSMLSIVSSGAGSFTELLVARTGFAVAQAAQNPVSFSLIPDLFPANKSTALAGYNCAIYLGRALSFASVLAAHRVRSGGLAGGAGPVAPVGTMADAAAGAAGSEGVQLSMVPLDKLDLQRMSIIYTTGDMAAVTPL
jgi:MFS family permease